MNSSRENRKTVWITDAAVVTAMGNTSAELWDNLVAGRTAIRPISRFPVDAYETKIAACIDDLEDTGERSLFHALLDRLLNQIQNIPSDARLITASTKAGIDNLEKVCRAKPAVRKDILLSSVSELIAEKLKLAHKGFNVSAACASSTIAVSLAAQCISSGRASAVLVCCLDLVSEFVFSGFAALRALSQDPCRPFDRDRNGLSLGEGGAIILLMSRERAVREGRNHLGTIVGWGAANDATHITAPARDGCGLILAVHQALKLAGLEPSDIAVVSAHGTGTIFNDAMELTAFREVFRDHKIPVHSIKGAIGHTLGAAGGIEVALGIRSLASQIIPPTIGFQNPAPGAEGIVKSESTEISGKYLLTTNSGFGGINAAVILEKGETS